MGWAAGLVESHWSVVKEPFTMDHKTNKLPNPHYRPFTEPAAQPINQIPKKKPVIFFDSVKKTPVIVILSKKYLISW